MNTPPPIPGSNERPPTALAAGIALSALSAILLGIAATLPVTAQRHSIFIAAIIAVALGGGGSLLCLLGRTRTDGERRAALLAGGIASICGFIGLGLIGWHGVKLGIHASHVVQRQIERANRPDATIPAARSIVVQEGAVTFDTVRPFYVAWAEKNLVAIHDAHATGDAARDDAIRAALRGWMLWRIVASDAPEPAQFVRWQATAGAHPLMDFIAGSMPGPSAARIKRLERADKDLAAWPDAAVALFLTRVELWKARGKKNPRGAEVSVLDALRAALANGPISPDDHWPWQHLLAEGAADDFLEAHGKAGLSIIDAAPAIEPWLKHRLRGGYEVALAWNARGSGWASEVSHDGWQGFAAHLATAREHLEKAWKLNPKHPAAATGMISVAMGSGDDPVGEMRLWFDRAIAARLDYVQAYDRFRWGLRPRWHGSHEAMLAFAEACLDTGRFDTQVPWQYYETLEEIAYEGDDHDAYYAEEADWNSLREMLDGYLAAARTPADRTTTLTRAAILADLCGELKECRRYLELAKFELAAPAAKAMRVDLGTWLPRTSAQTGPAAAPIRDATAAEELGDFKAALAFLTTAAAVDGLDAPARAFIAQRTAQTRDLLRLADAPWEPLIDANLTGWKRAFGSPRMANGDTLEARSSMMLIREQPIGATFELRGEVEFTEGSKDIIAGFGIGNPTSNGSDWVSASLRRRYRNVSSVLFARRYWDDAFYRHPRYGTRAKVHLRVAGGRLVLMVDGASVLERQVELPSALADTSRLALVAPLRVEENTVRWHRLELRRVANVEQ